MEVEIKVYDKDLLASLNSDLDDFLGKCKINL